MTVEKLNASVSYTASGGGLVYAITFDYFIKNIEQVPEEAKLQYVIHTVKRGETLSGIAYKYKVKQSQMARLNNISVRSNIHPNQKLKIPISNFKSTDFMLNTSGESMTMLEGV